MSRMCEMCYKEVMDCENIYNVGYKALEEWVCEECFMDYVKEEYAALCEDCCFVATAIADSLGFEYVPVSKFSIKDFIIDHKIDDLKGGGF